MTTPRIEEMKVCTKCKEQKVLGDFNAKAEELVRKEVTKAHQAGRKEGIDEAVEIVKEEKTKWNANGEYYANVTEALDNTIEVLTNK